MGNKSCIFSTNDECVICKERKIDTLFLPCGHFGKLNLEDKKDTLHVFLDLFIFVIFVKVCCTYPFINDIFYNEYSSSY